MLAEFTSDQFYKNETSDSGLRIMTALPDKKAINAFQNVEVQWKSFGVLSIIFGCLVVEETRYTAWQTNFFGLTH